MSIDIRQYVDDKVTSRIDKVFSDLVSYFAKRDTSDKVLREALQVLEHDLAMLEARVQMVEETAKETVRVMRNVHDVVKQSAK